MVLFALVVITISMTILSVMVASISANRKKKREEELNEVFSCKNITLPGLPGPTGIPLLGSSLFLSKFSNNWEGFSVLRKIYGDVYGITIGTTRCVIVSSVNAIKEVLVTRANDFDNRPEFLRFHAIFRGNRNICE